MSEYYSLGSNSVTETATDIMNKVEFGANQAISSIPDMITSTKNYIESAKPITENVLEFPSFNNILRQVLRYLIEGLVVAIAGYYIPSKKPDLHEVVMIALTAASTFALLELYMPDSYMMARLGFGFTTGQRLIPTL